VDSARRHRFFTRLRIRHRSSPQEATELGNKSVKSNNLFLTIALLLTLYSSAIAQKVSVDYDRKAEFARYRTYSLMESKNPASSRVWCRRILDNIQLRLAVRGLLPGRPGESVDLYVVYNAGLKEQTVIEGYDYNYGQGWRWAWSDDYSRMNTALEKDDTLVIDLIDARENRLVWRGVATDTLSGRPSNTKKIDRAAEKMFAKYPSKPE
jgi:Domain of unknown function (DUF4136)